MADLCDLRDHERRVYSQSGEDGVLARIFECIGTTNRYFVEFGAKDGFNLSNTALLRVHRGWNGLLLDPCAAPGSLVKRERVTVENVDELFRDHGVPTEFDLLSIDVDGNDYWLWKAISAFTPRVVVIEYNIFIPLPRSQVVPYDPERSWNGSSYHGASLSALQRLGHEKGYALIYTDSWAPNAFFALRSALPPDFVEPPIEKVASWGPLDAPEEVERGDWLSV